MVSSYLAVAALDGTYEDRTLAAGLSVCCSTDGGCGWDELGWRRGTRFGKWSPCNSEEDNEGEEAWERREEAVEFCRLMECACA